VATTTLISIEDYLGNTSFNPDVVYVDGELKERTTVVSAHGLVQSLLGGWFLSHEDEWRVRAGVEIRTRVSPTRSDCRMWLSTAHTSGLGLDGTAPGRR
jgi:hypothetical protein